MRRVLRPRWLCCSLVGLGSALLSQQPSVNQRAAVATEVSQSSPFVGEQIRLKVRVEIDHEWFTANGVPLFRQQVGVPAQLLAPWLDEQEGLVWLPRTESVGPDVERSTMAINAAVVSVLRLPDVQREGREFRVYQYDRRLRVIEAGQRILSAPKLSFAYATEFVDDIVQGRTALDRHLGEVAGEESVLQVRALPEGGRPAGFGGAVGRFDAVARVRPTEVTLGEQLQLELVIDGDGYLGAFEPPRLDGLSGLHVLGSMQRSEGDQVIVTYDLQPMSTVVREVPAIDIPFFDPTPPGAYRIARTESVSLVVKPGVGGDSGVRPSDPVPVLAAGGLADIATMDAMPSDQARSLPPLVLVAGLVLPWLLIGAFWSWRRSQSRTPGVVAGNSGTVAAFVAAIERGEVDLERVFVVFLGARLGSSVEGATGDELRQQLVLAGISEGMALRAERLREKLAKARYAGLSPGGAAAALSLVEELAEAFDRAGARS